MIVIVDEKYVPMAQDWAWRVSAWWAEDAKRRRWSSRGCENNLPLLTQSKLGEVALAQALGLDPVMVVDWHPEAGPDDGVDVVMEHGTPLDAKTSPYFYLCLLWPLAKNDLYPLKRFFAMVAVGADPQHPTHFVIEGWVSKWRFHEHHKVAREGDCTGLQPGTWYMHKTDLLPIETLIEIDGRKVAA